MPGRMPPTSQLDWLISTTAMIVLFWSRATRDLLKSFGWGIATLHRLIQRRNCHPRRPPHSISPLEEDGFELFVPLGINAAPSWSSGTRKPYGAHEGSFSVAAPIVRIHLPPG